MIEGHNGVDQVQVDAVVWCHDVRINSAIPLDDPRLACVVLTKEDLEDAVDSATNSTALHHGKAWGIRKLCRDNRCACVSFSPFANDALDELADILCEFRARHKRSTAASAVMIGLGVAAIAVGGFLVLRSRRLK